MADRPSPVDPLLAALRAGHEPDPQVAAALAHQPGDLREASVAALIGDPAGRRWLRSALLPALPGEQAATLAARLLAYPEDFAREHRDRTTPAVIRHLPLGTLLEAAPVIAAGNAAGALWSRLADEHIEALLEAARRVLEHGTTAAREATVSILLLDPYDPLSLVGPARVRLLDLALDDRDAEIRGLAAEVAAGEAPELLRARGATARRDPSERVRTATWAATFAGDPEAAIEEAARLLDDEAAPLAARRSALLALGEALPTADIAPLLARLVAHPDPDLAQDAANLLWSRHRAPEIAFAAAESPHASVRDIAQRLLDPTRGSPEAGGFRPGAADQGYDFYERLFRG